MGFWLILLGLLIGGVALAEDAGPEPILAADPDEPGPSLPPVGRSLFDFLTMREVNGQLVQDVPFPFTALQARIEDTLGWDEPTLKRVLIPLGRSLQRNAANPDFFAFPRAVVAVDRESAPRVGESGMLLADRLYLGYQEKAATIEVISYNEAAGRFEYQVVRDYREGGEPKVYYADRPTCIACHRNHAPIFSKPLWDETNANAAIAATLSGLQDSYYGIPVARGIDIPQAIDDATDRANEYPALLRIWQDACQVACRADAVLAVLHYKLAGNRHPGPDADSPAKAFAAALGGLWRSLWPGGLAVPTGDEPNRAPLAAALDPKVPLSESEALRLSTVERQFEPFEPRPPREVWRAPEDPEVALRLVEGLARFIAAADIRRLDEILWQSEAPTADVAGPCVITTVDLGEGRQEVRLDCSGGQALTVEGYVQMEGASVVGGAIVRTAIDGQLLTHLEVAAGSFAATAGQRRLVLDLRERTAGLHARLPDGNAIRALEIVWAQGEGPAHGRATAVVAGDAVMLADALAVIRQRAARGASDALAAPLRRAALMPELFAQLGEDPIAWCCLDDSGMPAASLEP